MTQPDRPSCPDTIECPHEAALGEVEAKLELVHATATAWARTGMSKPSQVAGRHLLRLLDGEGAPDSSAVVSPATDQTAEPDDTDLTEADIDQMMAAGTPVQIVTGPPATYGAVAATGQTALRERIRRVLAQIDGFDFDSLEPHDYQIQAAALAAVLPASVDRADVLREAADVVAQVRDTTDVNVAEYQRYDFRQRVALGDAEGKLRRMAREAAELRRVAAETRNTTETDSEAPGVVQCTASVLQKPHGPHGWEPQPGMTPVRCPGFCKCDHPKDEHSVYGCVDGCGCEYLPPTGAPAGGAPTPCGPAPDECGDEPCANHEREQAHAEGEHCFCGPECDHGCTCGVAGDCFVPDGHYADCPQATPPAGGAPQPKEA